tara:strand:- start:4431 stop:5582 length:1152 start_codon:yes stop_codon:yes gene_type:complete
MMRRKISYLLFLSFAVSGCDLPERTQPPPNPSKPIESGAEGGPCNDDQVCNDGLICVEELCVQDTSDPSVPGPGDAGVTVIVDAGVGEVPDSGEATAVMTDAGADLAPSDAGLFLERPDAHLSFDEDLDAGSVSTDSGVTLADSGNVGFASDGGVDVDAGTPPVIVDWHEACGDGAVCTSGLLCIDGRCEEPCTTEGMVSDACFISQAEYCGQSNDGTTLVCEPLSGIVLELTWGGGQNNFDLYFKRAQEGWCSPYTCYPQTCLDGVSWSGSDGDAAANPQMLMEDSCGDGPEIISLEAPSQGAYAVAIHRKDSTDCPNTDEGEVVEARVKLYVNGVHYNTYERDMDANLDFWELGYLNWQSNGDLLVQEYHNFTGNWQCAEP